MTDLSLLLQGLALQRASVQSHPDFTITPRGAVVCLTAHTHDADVFVSEFIPYAYQWVDRHPDVWLRDRHSYEIPAADIDDLAYTMECHGLTVERKA